MSLANMSFRKMKTAITQLVGLATLFATGNSIAGWGDVNMPVGVTEISQRVYGLHMLILWICVIIGIVVFGAIFYSIIKHRKSVGHQAAQFHESTTVEIIWTVIPFVILIGMAIPATKTLIAMEDTSGADMTIQVTGYQWKWQYKYLDQGVNFFSTLATPRSEIFNKAEKDENYLLQVDNEVVLPINKKIRILLTSNDVNHAWWVPDLAVKKDAIPGFINEMWTKIDKPGIYRGQCAELCGRDHGFMPIVVRAVEQAEFDKWVAVQKGDTMVAAAGTTNSVNDAADTPVADAMKSATESPVSTLTTAVETTMDSAASAVKEAATSMSDSTKDMVASATESVTAPIAAATTTMASAASGANLKTAMAKGEGLYGIHCASCHMVNGEGIPNVFPAIKGSAIATGDVKAHIDIVVNGKMGTAMRAFGPQFSDEDIAAILTYQRNAWGNNTGDVVTADQVKASR